MASRTCAARWAWRAASGPHSGDAQFYVNVADNGDLDPLPTRWGYAVFGRVVEGMEVVDRISVSPHDAMGPFKQDAPQKAVRDPEDRAAVGCAGADTRHGACPGTGIGTTGRPARPACR